MTHQGSTDLLDVIVYCSERQRRYVESADHGRISPSERLLDLLRRRSARDFNNFIECLVNTGQRHVASLLSTGGGLSAVAVRRFLGQSTRKVKQKGVRAMPRPYLCVKEGVVLI